MKCPCDQCQFARGQISYPDSLGCTSPVAFARVAALVGLTDEETQTPGGKIVSRARTPPTLPLHLLVALWERVRPLGARARAAAVVAFHEEHQEEIETHEATRAGMKVQWK